MNESKSTPISSMFFTYKEIQKDIPTNNKFKNM